MYITSYSCQILVKLNFLDRFSKNIPISDFFKIHLVGAKLFHEDGRMDGRTHGRADVTKLVVAFRNFANAPKNNECTLPNLQKVKF